MTTLPRVLVVDDDATVRRMLTRYLGFDDYDVVAVSSASDALIALEAKSPDLVLLDVMLGVDDGLDLLETMRRSHPKLPVIFLTAKTEPSDRVTGLRLGADDYVVKPFSCAEVAARIASVLRRASPPDPARTLSYDNLTIDLGTREVVLRGKPVTITGMEFDLLSFFAAAPRQVFSREQLLEQVWKSSAAWQSTDTVTEHVRRLRQRVERDPTKPLWISTVRGVGYSFNPAA